MRRTLPAERVAGRWRTRGSSGVSSPGVTQGALLSPEAGSPVCHPAPRPLSPLSWVRNRQEGEEWRQAGSAVQGRPERQGGGGQGWLGRSGRRRCGLGPWGGRFSLPRGPCQLQGPATSSATEWRPLRPQLGVMAEASPAAPHQPAGKGWLCEAKGLRPPLSAPEARPAPRDRARHMPAPLWSWDRRAKNLTPRRLSLPTCEVGTPASLS